MSVATDRDGNVYTEGDLLLKAGKTVKIDGADALGGVPFVIIPLVGTMTVQPENIGNLYFQGGTEDGTVSVPASLPVGFYFYVGKLWLEDFPGYLHVSSPDPGFRFSAPDLIRVPNGAFTTYPGISRVTKLTEVDWVVTPDGNSTWGS